MTLIFFKTTELNGSIYVKIPMGFSAILNNQNDGKYCFLWSIPFLFHPVADSKNGHPTRVFNYRQLFDELNIQGIDFANGFICSDVHKFCSLNNLSKNMFD